jgi:hypothetical protein
MALLVGAPELAAEIVERVQVAGCGCSREELFG